MKNNLKTLQLKSTTTVITEFRSHLGKYWRDAVNRNHVTLVSKSFNEDGLTVFMNKELFDQLVSLALRIPYQAKPRKRARRIKRVLLGPRPKHRMLAEIMNRVE